MGVATILEAREIAIIATGEHKAAHRASARSKATIDLEVAATFLQRHPNTTFYVDRAAAAELTRIKTPWLLDEVEWTQALIDARGDLAVAAHRQGDPQAHAARLRRAPACRRSSRKFGSPGDVNGMVFNALGAKIRGKIEAADGPARSSASRRTPTTT